MGFIIKGGNVFIDGQFKKLDIMLSDGVISRIDNSISPVEGFFAVDAENKIVIPGLADGHVHFREPGFSYKETIKQGSMAAAHGGYTAVCTMPNLNPVPDSVENLRAELDIIERDAVIGVYPFGAITVSQKGQELSDLEGMADKVCGFSDDGKGVQSGEIMRRAMVRVKKLGKVISAHCEDESLLAPGWCCHDGDFGKSHGLVGNNPASEYEQVRRDLKLAMETGCAYNVCHVSTKESVEAVRGARAMGGDVTCETGPHYLLLDDSMIEDKGKFRMNPPIRSKDDRKALVEGILDGTITMICTDHAPHSREEKEGTMAKSLNGIVGLECAFPVLYTGLVKTGIMELGKLVELMSVNVKRRFGLPGGEGIALNAPADIAIFDIDNEFTVEPEKFLSKGKSTPFEGWRVFGKCLMTIFGGEIVWREGI